MSSLSIAESIVLGLVEGITEYLPISSTGHLIVAARLMGIEEGTSLDAYTVIIQIGAIAAVLGIYRARIGQLLQGLLGKSRVGRQVLLAVIVAFLPAGLVGAAFNDTIDEWLLNPATVAIAWIVGGAILLFLAPKLRPDGAGSALESMTLKQAGIIGGAQVLALIPGTSRSLVTIVAAVLVGMSISAAVEFSFLLGLLTLTAATAYKLLSDGGQVFSDYGTTAPLVGIVVAGLSAFVAVRTFVAFLKSRSLSGFGWYRIAAGIITFGLLAGNVISN